jgi:hypothetical protein
MQPQVTSINVLVFRIVLVLLSTAASRMFVVVKLTRESFDEAKINK